MATIVNERNALLASAAQRGTNPPDADIILSVDAPAFHVSTSNVAFPSTITVTAHLIKLVGTVAFTASGATITDNHDNTATVSYSGLASDSATITATITTNGQTFTKSVNVFKVLDGAKGDPGTSGSSGNQYATVYLYQWTTANLDQTNKPNGTSSYTWATGANTSYSGTDAWSTTVPANPGTPGLKLWIAAVSISAAGGTASTTVSYNNSVVQSWSQNGTTGPSGASGAQTTTVLVYRWDTSIPAGPVGTSTYTWSNGTFAAPTSTPTWSIDPGTTPSKGMTLWGARVTLTDSASATQSTINWTNAAIFASGYAGNDGAAASAGASYVTAYCASSTGSATSAPAQTQGKTSLPAANSGGITGTWSKTVPQLTAGQYMYQTDGIYDPSTDLVTWSTPYWSSLKVGSLSAITANMGQITAGSIDIGTGATSWHVDSSGNTWAGDSSFATAPYKVTNGGAVTAKNLTLVSSQGTTVIDGSGLKVGFEAPGTKNSDLTPSINNAATTANWSGVSGAGKPADNASADITLIGRNGATVIGNTVTKTGGTAGWNADAYSAYGYTGGAYASGVATNTNYSLMMGLNGDPTSDSNYSSLDYAFYLAGGGTVEIYEGGNGRGQVSTYVAGDVFLVAYDGANVNYSKNGSILRTLSVGSLTYPLYFDSSFNDVGGSLNNIRFGPMSDISAGVSANNAIPGINNAIADKLSKTSASSLAATVTISTNGSILTGTTTNGAYMSPSGFYGVQGGVVKFSVPISGDPTFAGQLSAAYGSFGSVTIAAGGSLSSGLTGYNTGTQGFWLDSRFSIKTANGSSFLCDPANNVLSMNGVALTNYTLPKLALAITDNLSTSKANATSSQPLGSATASVSNAVGTVSYVWSVTQVYTDPSNSPYTLTLTNDSTATVTVNGYPGNTNTALIYTLQCVATDANNMTVVKTIYKRCQFGTAV